MTKPLPKWIMHRYSVLWTSLKSKEFDFERAAKALKERNKVLLSQIISELKQAGWLTIRLHPKDSRKRIYLLKSPEEAIKGITEND